MKQILVHLSTNEDLRHHEAGIEVDDAIEIAEKADI